jgi:stage II sporulation SpoAA-like protein
MIHFELLRDRGILILEPRGALTAGDFAALAATVDPFIEEHGDLRGLIIEAPSFPGWDDFAALVSHLRFVRDHHRRVRRVAVVSDSKVLTALPKIAGHFVAAEVRTFDAGRRDQALAWIASPPA